MTEPIAQRMTALRLVKFMGERRRQKLSKELGYSKRAQPKHSKLAVHVDEWLATRPHATSLDEVMEDTNDD